MMGLVLALELTSRVRVNGVQICALLTESIEEVPESGSKS